MYLSIYDHFSSASKIALSLSESILFLDMVFAI